MRTRIKMCGMKEIDDVQTACRLGVDAIGFVFCECSSRYVDIERAKQLVNVCTPFTATVGLFKNAEQKTIEDMLNAVNINYLQFHGEETEAFCNQFGVPYIKAIPMQNNPNLQTMITEFSASANALLFDSHSAGASGGSGNVFDWNQLPDNLDIPMIVAGGLTPDNVSDLIMQAHPYGVDVSSGIEANKGIKDAQLMQQFIDSVVRADQHRYSNG